MSKNFKLVSKFKPSGDQVGAISELFNGLEKGEKSQTLFGATATGKTFTIANVIEKYNKPTLVISHNKTLAAQLASEFKEFFPDAAVHYFVSYYDYYQPEAYMPTTDTYIEKDIKINEEIDRLRHASTQSLLSRKDVIIVSSVSCIYGLGSPEEYSKVNMHIRVGQKISRIDFIKKLVNVQYERTNVELQPGQFRSIGLSVEIMPVSEIIVYQIDFIDGTISRIQIVDSVSRTILSTEQEVFIFPAKHFMTNKENLAKGIKSIKDELKKQVAYFEKKGKILEAERIKRRTTYDLAMIKEMGYCNGIENYSGPLSGKKTGEAPETLLSYFKYNTGNLDFLTIIDESHVTLPQLSGMYAGDASRKDTLVEHGFRLPSAKDNRPLKYEEFKKNIGPVIYVSATPGKIEKLSGGPIVEQLIRPTGLLDPVLVVRSARAEGKYEGQVSDFLKEVSTEVKKGGRVIVTTLTKKMSEDLSVYLKEKNIKAEYLHSEIKTIDRIKILTKFRKGEFDCLVGVNLLREGLDLPEVSLIGILDADKEGFLRNETSLIQTIGRAARNKDGRVILYADKMTNSLKSAIDETNRRRDIQIAYNKKHNITPVTITKDFNDITQGMGKNDPRAVSLELQTDLLVIKDENKTIYRKRIKNLIKQKESSMELAVKELDFETASILRDEIRVLKHQIS